MWKSRGITYTRPDRQCIVLPMRSSVFLPVWFLSAGITSLLADQRCGLSITDPSGASIIVSYETTTVSIIGQLDVDASGSLTWSNAQTGASGSAVLATNWSIAGVPVTPGTNLIALQAEGVMGLEVTTNAADAASQPAYNSSWSSESNGGSGFGPWLLSSDASSPDNGGFFIAEGQGNLNIGPRAWGLYANSGASSWAERPFAQPLGIGQTFRCRLDNNAVQSGGIIAVGLYNASTQSLWVLRYDGGSAVYEIAGQPTDIPFTDQGLDLALTLTSSSNYSLQVISDGGTVRTITGTLTARVDTTIDRVRFWNVNAGFDEASNFYVNDLAITRSTNANAVACTSSVTIIRAPQAPGSYNGNLSIDQLYQETNGLVAGEAEFYHDRRLPVGAAWEFIAAGTPGAMANFRSRGYMHVLPDNGAFFTYASGPAVDYKINIATPGAYRLWLRWSGFDGDSDSLFAGIVELADGPGNTPDWYEFFDNQDANFSSDPWDSEGGFEANEPAPARASAMFNFESPGIYTLRFVPREDGVALDSWVLQREGASSPISADPLIVVPDSITMHHNAKAGMPVLRNDSGPYSVTNVQIVEAPRFGTATPLTDGRIVYTHTSGTPASDRFTYRVGGPDGAFSAPAAVLVNFSSDERIPNTTVTMPVAPPPVSYAVVDAFPSLANFTFPTSMESPPGDTNRLFVLQRNGLLFVINGIGGENPQRVQYMDIRDRVDETGFNELGAKGITFHPGFATNRFFYVTYCHWDGANRRVRLSRFTADAGNPGSADPATELILINQINDLDVHNINDVAFGPDGYLYLGLGDEGFFNGADGLNNSQIIDHDLWSGILRLDVDKRPGNPEPNAHPGIPRDGNGNAYYSIPADNPFIGATSFNGLSVNPDQVRTEFYAVGLRNPWNYSFDSLTGDFWVADVGNNLREEVMIMPKGGNGGWVFYEGTAPGPRPDRIPPPGFTYVPPVWEYGHGSGEFQGRSIIGGIVYRGDSYPELYGRYILADYVSGNIWTIERTDIVTNVTRIAGEGGLIQFDVNRATGEMLMLDHGDGRVRKLATETSGQAFPEKLSETGFFADLADLSPNPGLIAYNVNLPFWSDYAVKSRWFIITNTTDRIGLSADGTWTYPEGMMWVKHFDMEMQRGNPDTKKRIETRVLVRNAQGSYGVSYRWNTNDTEAFLAPDAGVNFNLAITNESVVINQDWRIPSRAECITCHNPAAGHALSFNTRQLNCPGEIGGASGNFISLIEDRGYTSNHLGNPALLGRHISPENDEYSLEARARSYLAVNCSYCHMGPGSPAPGAFDARAFRKLDQTGMLLGQASANLGNTNNLLLVPGDTAYSIIWNRIGASNNFSRMPPLASSEVDHTGVKLIADWIASLTTRQSFDQWQLAVFGNTNRTPDSARNLDTDGDGASDYEEYLTYSDPTDANQRWSARIEIVNDQPHLAHDLADRMVTVEYATNLHGGAWSFLNIPENDRRPIARGETKRLIVPDQPGGDEGIFFRFFIDDL